MHVYLSFLFNVVFSGKFQDFAKRGHFVQVKADNGCHLVDVSGTFVKIHISSSLCMYNEVIQI